VTASPAAISLGAAVHLLLAGCRSDSSEPVERSTSSPWTASSLRSDQARALEEALELHPAPCKRSTLSELAARSRVVTTPWEKARHTAGVSCADPEVTAITAYDTCGSYRVLAVVFRGRDIDYAYYDASSGRLAAFVERTHVLGICHEFGEPPSLDLSSCTATELCEG
jgi:hypothetical protein